MSTTDTPSKQRPAGTGQARRRRRRNLSAAHAAIAAAAIGAAATVVAAGLGVFAKSPSPASPSAPTVPMASPSVSRPSPTPEATGPLVPGDNSVFVTDVTYPDGSTVTEGQHFIKKWEIRNTGTVLWAGRYLAAHGISRGSCTYPSRVVIPTTHPGQDVTISVPVTASDSPGLCFVTWKMETGTGALYFPNEIGIWFSVNVIIAPR
jgi:hypothetical protein